MALINELLSRQQKTGKKAVSPVPKGSFYQTEHDTANEVRARQTTVPTRAGAAGSAVGSSGVSNKGLPEKQYTPQQPKQTTAAGQQGSTNDPYVAQANALYQQLMNRGPFRYDLQGDMLYRQYADQYQQLGRQAMQDTMGYAAGQTGGYNSSWGQTLGNQAYQGYLTQLNNMVPDFYDRAYQAYLNEGDRLMQQYQLALQHPGYISAMRGSGNAGSTAAQEDATQGTAGQSLAQTQIASAAPDWNEMLLKAYNRLNAQGVANEVSTEPDFNAYWTAYYNKLLEEAMKNQ